MVCAATHPAMAMHWAVLPPCSADRCAGPSSSADAPISNSQLLEGVIAQMASRAATALTASSADASSAAVTPLSTTRKKRSWQVYSRAVERRQTQLDDQMPPLKRSNTSSSGCSNASTTSAVDAGCTPDSACSSQSLVHVREEPCQTLLMRCHYQQQHGHCGMQQPQQDSISLVLQQHLQQHAQQQALRQLQQQYPQQIQQQHQQQLQQYQRQHQQHQQQATMMAAAAATHNASSFLCVKAAPAPKPQPQLLQTSLLAWAGSVLRAGSHSAYLLAQHIWSRVEDSLDLMLLLSLGAHSPAHVAMLVCLWVASKLEDNRRNVMPSSKLALATGMLPWGITSVELHIMDLLDWRPYKGWCGASCCVTDVS